MKLFFEELSENRENKTDEMDKVYDELIAQKNEMKEWFSTSLNIYQLGKRIEHINQATSIFQKEELKIDEQIIEERKKNIQKEIEEQTNKVNELLENLFNQMDYSSLITFITLLETKEYKIQLQFTFDILTNEQKEKIYVLLHEKSIENKDERILVHHFEQRMSYPFYVFEKYEKNEASVYQTFIKKYVSYYTDTVKDTIVWLETEVSELKLSEGMAKRYAEAAINRLGIVQEIENEIERKEKQKEIAEELTQLILKNLKK